MKREFLEELGIEKDAIDKIMARNGKAIETHKTQAEAAIKERDAYKSQLDEVNDKLKAFDNVDLDALRGEIETLKGDISTKEADFQAELASRDFDALLGGAITEARGKNPKAIMALLDTEALRGSKNQKTDAEAAIKALIESDAYLFESTEAGEGTPAKVSTGGKHNEPDDTGSDPFVAAAMKGAGLATGKEE